MGVLIPQVTQMLSKIGETWVSMLIIISKFGSQVAQSQPSVVVHIYNPTPGNLRQEDHYKSEVSLDYLTRHCLTHSKELYNPI